MGVKGRHSSADLAQVRGGMARIEAPEDLTPPQREEWTAIVNSLPPDWFRPADIPLLRAFVIAATLHRQATAEIERDGITLTNDRGNRCMNPAVSVMTSASSAMTMMAVKLRLCPSSRYAAAKAATKVANSPLSEKPWQREKAA